MHNDLPWKGALCIIVNNPADASTLKVVRRRCYPELRLIRVQDLTIDQAVWDALIDLVNNCEELSFLHLHECKIDRYDIEKWKRMRPIFSILISNCTDAEGRYCSQWKDTDVMENLCQPLSEQACCLTVQYNYNKTYSTLHAACVPFTKINDRHKDVQIYDPRRRVNYGRRAEKSRPSIRSSARHQPRKLFD